MAKFYALQVIMCKITYAQVPDKYKSAALAIIDEKGFYIDSDGKCKPKPVSEA